MTSGNQSSIAEEIVIVTHSIQERSDDKIRQQLIYLINELINKDFDALVQLLYRIDVYENKIRLYLVQDKSQDSAAILADLIIERQIEKIESRKKYSGKKNIESDEEIW